jgi:putative ABC transport system permease protein
MQNAYLSIGRSSTYLAASDRGPEGFMSWLHGLAHRLRTVFRPGTHARDLDEEMRFHAELDAVNERDPAGAPRRFGNRTYYREEVRRLTWIGPFDVMRQDLSYAWRATRRSPGFTAVVVLTLALGIGANASVFSILDRLYLRPPAGVDDPWAIRRTWIEHFRTFDGEPFRSQAVSVVTYEAITAATGVARASALYTTDFAARLGRRPTDPTVAVVYATASYFSVLGVRPALGRLYTADEDRFGSGAPVVVVSHAFWENRLHGDSAVLGRTIPIGSGIFTIVGVLDRQFTGLDLRPSEIWMPLASMLPAAVSRQRPDWWRAENATRFWMLRRATPTLTDAEFTRRATAVIRDEQRAKGLLGDTLRAVWTGPILEARGPVKPGYEMTVSTRLAGVAAIVLVIAAANVINLLLARAARRRREIAVRLALGVSRGRLARMLLTETLVLAMLGGAGGLIAAWWGASLLRALILAERAWPGPAVDGRVVVFAIAVTLVAGLVAGIVPAMQASTPHLASALRGGARDGVSHRSRLRSALVIAQTALSVVLLVGAALFVRSLHNVQRLDLGFDADRLYFGHVRFAEGERPPNAVVGAAMRDIAARLRGRPGVEAVARSNFEPMRGIGFESFFIGADSNASFGRRAPTVSIVSAPFFETVGLRMLRGRTFSGGDVEHPPAEVVVNEAMATLVWPGRDPIGSCVRIAKRDNPCAPVVGVVETARLTDVIEREAAAQFYLPVGSNLASSTGETIIVRARDAAGTAAVAELAGLLRRRFPGAATIVTPMTETLEPEYRPWRLGASLFTGLGVLAMAVAVIGIFGTVSYGVSQRMHEFGVRVALGARLADVVQQVVGEGLRTAGIGVALGIALALAAGRLVAAMLYGLAPWDPTALAIASAALLATAAIAALLPAWRAGRADPLTVLRVE